MLEPIPPSAGDQVETTDAVVGFRLSDLSLITTIPPGTVGTVIAIHRSPKGDMHTCAAEFPDADGLAEHMVPGEFRVIRRKRRAA